MSYRALLSEARPSFLILGLLARLPYAMAPLGTLLLLQSATGSYGFAGVAAGLQNLAAAGGGLVVGRLTERVGLRRLGALTAVANACALAGLIFATHGGRVTMLAAALGVGVAQAQVGLLVRTHWAWRAAGGGLLSTALAYEAAADETSFIVGPAAVGLLAAIAVPVPVAAGAGLLLVAAVLLARRYAGGGPVRRGTGGAGLPVVPLAALMLAMAFMGAIFGVLQTGVTAYARHLGNPTAAGLLYAELGAGSALAGLACGWLPVRFGPRARYRTFAAALLVGTTLIALLPPPVAFAVAGATVAPYMISISLLTARVAAPRLAVAMTIVGAGGPVGTAAGQAAAGMLVDRFGYHSAFVLAPILAGMATLLALAPGDNHRGPRSSDPPARSATPGVPARAGPEPSPST